METAKEGTESSLAVISLKVGVSRRYPIIPPIGILVLPVIISLGKSFQFSLFSLTSA